MRTRNSAMFAGQLMLATQLLLAGISRSAAPSLPGLERSFWLHASLAALPQRGYWGTNFPVAVVPTEGEIADAARILASNYCANRLYLIHHNEIAPGKVENVFRGWRRALPTDVEIVPALVLRMYDKQMSEVFPPVELQRLAAFFKSEINASRIAVYDVGGERDQGPGLAVLARVFPGGLIRLGAQPGEKTGPPFVAAVQDTWSAFCHGRSNDDWLQPGFGAETLRQWVGSRNGGTTPIAWDLIVVAWDYSATPRGGYPGYDDARKNMPLPAGRNALAVREILRVAQPGVFAGFSSDLLILHVNSRSDEHDGPANSFYEGLKRGEVYRGYYGIPFGEIVDLYRGFKDGRGDDPKR